MDIFKPRASIIKLEAIGLGRPKYVVGCTSSMCACRCSGRLYCVVRTITSPSSPSRTFFQRWNSYDTYITHQKVQNNATDNREKDVED